MFAAAVVLALPTASQAGVQTVGSDLSKPADTQESHAADTAFWNTMIDGDPSGAVMPADGQVTVGRLKGAAIQDPAPGALTPDPQFHLQVLHPKGSGLMHVELSSGTFVLPIVDATDPIPSQISSYQPVNLCVHKGDYVDFNDWGGAEWHWPDSRGIKYQVFSSLTQPDSSVDWYEADNGTNVGSEWSAAGSLPKEELLLQTTLATGPDATDICPGGYAQHIFQGVTIAQQSVKLITSTGLVKVRALCPGPTYGSCQGTMTLTATLGGKGVTLGSAPFDIGRNVTATVPFTLSPANVKLVQQAKTAAGLAVASAHDNPAADPHAAVNGVPVQSKVTSGGATLTPDKALPAVTKKKKKKCAKPKKGKKPKKGCKKQKKKKKKKKH
ncbi:MAG: hypothetical protein QOD53_2543 [Thermoleophilaceae bacterium]|nr:hypothetical protein [Thermoleophilaceae bacterium]